jgi:acetolactate synthase-1/2/3 large subunit
MGMGVFKSGDPHYLGMLGMHGARSTNEILHNCDLLLAFGTRFDDRATGKVSEFCPGARIVHADIDDSEFGKIRKPHLALHGDIREILSLLLNHVEKKERKDWMDQIAQIKQKCPSREISDDMFSPANLIRSVAALVDSDTIVCTDVGQHQMWVAQYYPFSRPRTLLSSGGLGTMGFGLPAAIGAALANPERKVILFTGDGSLLMNIQELATLADLNLNLTIILFNNGHLGLVRQQQELFYDKNYIASRFVTNPDFNAIAEGFGITSYNLEDYNLPVHILSRALNEPKSCLINVPIDYSHNVMPIVPPGAANIESVEG